jgi:hypothetical protein
VFIPNATNQSITIPSIWTSEQRKSEQYVLGFESEGGYMIVNESELHEKKKKNKSARMINVQ